MKTDVFCQTSARKLGLTVNKHRARHYGVISPALMHYAEQQHLSTLAQRDSCIQSCRWKLPISPFLMGRLVPFYPFSQDHTKLLWKFDSWSIKEWKKEQTKQKKQPENLSGGLLLLPLSCQNKPHYWAPIMQRKDMNSNWLDLDQWLRDLHNKSGRPLQSESPNAGQRLNPPTPPCSTPPHPTPPQNKAI